jgi:chromosome segregation protein
VEASVQVTFDLGDDEIDRPKKTKPTKSDSEINEIAEDETTDEADNLTDNLTDSTEDPEANEADSSDRRNEWSISRRLRVTKQGTYTSTYYMDGQPCTLSELHERMNELRIYPEGYNVVLQGDVTAIISMNGRDRRAIIDELAGVAAFDRKIAQAKSKLDEVKEREDRCRIVEQELIRSRDRLDKDRVKAEKYQKLRTELLEKQKWESILAWRQLKQQEWELREKIEAGDRTIGELSLKVSRINYEIEQTNNQLNELNAQVKALGEDQLLALQTTQANQQAEQKQLQQRHEELVTSQQETQAAIARIEQKVKEDEAELERVQAQQQLSQTQLVSLQTARDAAAVDLQQGREQSQAIASANQAWVEQQTQLHRQIETLQKTLDPQRTEQARLLERERSLLEQIANQEQAISDAKTAIAQKQDSLKQLQSQELASQSDQIQALEEALQEAEAELQLQQATQKRLLEEQREKQRRLDKLEAQAQAIKETSGTGASQVIIDAKLPGVYGLVAQLGRVEPRYQLALEIAAGGRLGNIVVEDDEVAAAGIKLLKQNRGGRATFLPLNKIKPGRFDFNEGLKNVPGFIDYAVRLITCDNRYQPIFAYVFGNTVVFETLDAARSHLGKIRIVTLDGELLETSGAMTGGTIQHRSTLHFGTGGNTDSTEVAELQTRLKQISQILERCAIATEAANTAVKTQSQQLMQVKQVQREVQLQVQQLVKEINGLTLSVEQMQQQLANNRQELTAAKARLQKLATELPAKETQINQLRQTLAELENSSKNSEWQQIQTQQQRLEEALQTAQATLTQEEKNHQDLDSAYQRLAEKIATGKQQLTQQQTQQKSREIAIYKIRQQLSEITQQIQATQKALGEIEAKLGEEKAARDLAETKLRELHLSRQQHNWQIQQLRETQQQRREQLIGLQDELELKLADLPDPLPEVPEDINAKIFESLQNLQREIRDLQKRLQAMEPVNMLALEEYEQTTNRLQELQSKLKTLEDERTELLLRIENFTTTRLQAFQEAFDAVNSNFTNIFAEFSDGDGHLQLDDTEDPFNSGLNLVAHPKGKPVQRLASMSGGEKSLTALSFIFALQRYRPSPFYAFDEVDMFLDEANVERLAKMIKQQAQQAQFIVVSHKNPMLKSAERIIGVTQARGAHTQVVGLKVPS